MTETDHWKALSPEEKLAKMTEARDFSYDRGNRLQTQLGDALHVAHQFGGIEGDHHRAWVIDQMVRALTGDDYEEWVREHRAGEDGPDTYSWDEGIAP